MMTQQFLNTIKLALTILTLITLTACGGGGGGEGESNAAQPVQDKPTQGNTENENQTVEASTNKTFTISASSIVIKRISNDENVAVDISGIKSAPLTLKSGS